MCVNACGPHTDRAVFQPCASKNQSCQIVTPCLAAEATTEEKQRKYLLQLCSANLISNDPVCQQAMDRVEQLRQTLWDQARLDAQRQQAAAQESQAAKLGQIQMELQRMRMQQWLNQ
jgi:hypothetical protein